MSEIPNQTTNIGITIYGANMDTDEFREALGMFLAEQPWVTPVVRFVFAMRNVEEGDEFSPRITEMTPPASQP